MDAASNNSVDDIRDIRDKIKYPPVHGKYKVYIIEIKLQVSLESFQSKYKIVKETQ